ncbi:DUF3106 domain-containing protein [Lysobacter sp. 2RAF19]
MIRRHPWLVVVALLAMPAFAQQTPAPTPAPAQWEQLSPAERDVLIAPIRDRWNNADADQRRRMLEHARRWTTMTPEQREAAHKGMRRWDHLSPDQRDQARELFERMRSMPPEERHALKEKWLDMTPEQRKAWLDAHPPKD